MEDLSFVGLTPQTWPLFEALFEKHHGVRGGCWCAYYLQSSSGFTNTDRHGHKAAHYDVLSRYHQTGMLMVKGDEAIGYAQYGTWELFDRYKRNRVLRDEPLPDQPLWRISCLFVDKHHRHRHLVRPLVNAVLEDIQRQGGGIVEAFPFEFDENPDKFQFNGSVPFYRSLGFEKIDHIGLHEVRMRKIIGSSR
jgi:ribosomal protein S18 acetylase RimI-like enzyme